jgi:hypothetical protein
VPKFELYKHNDELFNIYYGIFYELWTFADFDRLCKLEKRGDEIKKKSSLKLLSQSQPNFAEMILGWSSSKFVSGGSALRSILFFYFNTFRVIFQKLLEIDVKFKLQKCAPCRDLPTLQFWSKSDYPSWSSCPFFIKFLKEINTFRLIFQKL